MLKIGTPVRVVTERFHELLAQKTQWDTGIYEILLCSNLTIASRSTSRGDDEEWYILCIPPYVPKWQLPESALHSVESSSRRRWGT